MRLAKRFIAFQPTTLSKTIDDALCCFVAITLRVVDDPGSVLAAVHTGGKPTGYRARKLRGFLEKVD
jgi:hypothetical protein